MRTGRLLLAAVCGVVLATGMAEAERGAVVVGGPAAERELAMIQTAAEAAMREAGWELPANRLAQKDADALLGCSSPTTPWTCIPPSSRKADIQHFLVISAEHDEGQDGAPVLVLTGTLITADPGAFVVLQRHCEYCADAKLIEASTELTRLVLRDQAVRAGRTVLAVRSTPSGATITLDGVRVGITDGQFPTFPGPHAVTIEKPGFVAETRSIEAREGETADVAVTLRATPATSPGPAGPSGERPSRLVPGIVTGVGVTVVLAGVALIAVDEDVERTGPQPDAYFDSAGVGLATVITGALIAGSGVYLWMRGSNRRSAPNVTMVPGGGTVGWRGSF